MTGVDSTEKLDMLRTIGADQVIDYTCNGRYLLGNPGLSHRIRAQWLSPKVVIRVAPDP